MGRAPCCDKANVKKGPWSPDEDLKLKNFIETNGTGGNWITLPSKAGLKRCGKSCRLRWINYLRPDIKHGSFTEEEENVIYQLHANLGSRWSLIAAQLPRRTDNDIKNYWNTRLKKKLELGDRGMSKHCHQQHRSYHNMPNLAIMGGQFHGHQNAVAMDGFLQQVTLPPYNYPLQHQYIAPQATQRVPLLPMLSQQKQQQQHQGLAVKRESTNEQTVPPYAGGDPISMLCMMENEPAVPPNAVDDPLAATRLCMIENDLQDCMPAPGDSGCMTNSSPVPLQQSPPAGPVSPVGVEATRQLSPSSSCSGLTTEVGHGGCGNFADSGMFNSSKNYDDPTSLVGSRSAVLMSIPDVLSRSQQLTNTSPAKKVHSAASMPASSIIDESDPFNSLADDFLGSYSSVCGDVLDSAFDQQLVKQEGNMDCWELDDFSKTQVLPQSTSDLPSSLFSVPRKPFGYRVGVPNGMPPQSPYGNPPLQCSQENSFPAPGQITSPGYLHRGLVPRDVCLIREG